MQNQSDLVRESVLKVNRRFEQTFRVGDIAALADLYTDSAQLLPPGSEPIQGKESIQNFWGAILQVGIKEIALTTLEVDVQGATAIETGQYMLHGTDGALMDRGKYLVIWKLVKGDWKFHWDMWNTSLLPKN